MVFLPASGFQIFLKKAWMILKLWVIACMAGAARSSLENYVYTLSVKYWRKKLLGLHGTSNYRNQAKLTAISV